MSAELLIFVGYSQDAKEEALAIRELTAPLQEFLKNLNRVAPPPSAYSTVDFFLWESKADIGVGGQDFAIAPHLERAAIAIFVFKEKVGLVTWQELNSCRNRPIERRVPTFALFPANPPSHDRLCNREVARSWTDLLDRRFELIEDWSQEHSKSVTPLELYQDKQHLKEILLSKLANLFSSLLVKDRSSPEHLEKDVTLVSSASENSNDQYLDSLSPLTQYDPPSLQQYRGLLRDNRLGAADLSDDEFLSRMGYRKAGRLTIAAALLFTKLPSSVIPAAIVRCTKYDGTNKSTPRNRQNCDGPLLDQIVEARAFIEVNINRRERPVPQSMLSETSYEYPMICVREILANAVCHRSYEDHERLIYVTLFTDRIEIKSPGSWASTIIPEGKTLPLGSLAGESVQRNMRLAQAISSVGMMEVEGSGIPSAIRECSELGAPEPVVEMRAGYVAVTIFPCQGWDSGIYGESSGNEEVSLVATTYQGQSIRVDPQDAQVNSEPLMTDYDPIVGLKEVKSLIERVARTDMSVLISGETGTGKELVARAIHDQSARRKGPFVDINSSAIPEMLLETELFGHQRGTFTGAFETRRGLFERASSSTLFLDEVDSLSLAAQVKLLRVLQERRVRRVGGRENIPVDVRIIAATSSNLEAAIASGKFRPDLYFRLRAIELKLPALRDRREDIQPLVQHFIDLHNKRFPENKHFVSEAAMQVLMNYDWPGNVRELQNAVEYAVALSSKPELSPADFSFEILSPKRPVKNTEATEQNQQDWNAS
jgi:predicted HTH transcriptional regulator